MNGAKDTSDPSAGGPMSPSTAIPMMAGANGNGTNSTAGNLASPTLLNKKRKKDGLKPIITTDGPIPGCLLLSAPGTGSTTTYRLQSASRLSSRPHSNRISPDYLSPFYRQRRETGQYGYHEEKVIPHLSTKSDLGHPAVLLYSPPPPPTQNPATTESTLFRLVDGFLESAFFYWQS
ncbi:hypothetical protein F4818DRAFT_230113 [Hypoxylon cercidicola]|nr:hypothetical protein F4818DRAFT_230113 [Hypoxylon cercidicola]